MTNCDIIIDANYAEIVKYHCDEKNDITLISSVKHYQIPYGVCEIENGGQLKHIDEKPEFSFLINTGMYIISSRVLPMIPKNEHYHITDLIDKVQHEDGKIGIYPISENAWIDTGEWDQYKNAIERLVL